MTQSNYVIGDTPEDLNRLHNVTLKEGQISTILYVLEGYIQGSDDYHFDDDFKEDVDNIFYRLETVLDNFYDKCGKQPITDCCNSRIQRYHISS